METLTTPRQLQSDLYQVAARAQVIDVLGFERRAPGEAMAELVPRVSTELHGAIGVFGRVLERYGDVEPSGADRDLDPAAPGGTDRDARDPDGPRQIADLSFIARADLRRRCEEVAGLGHGDDVRRIVEACGSSRRHLVMSAAAVETALSACEGLPRLLGDAFAGKLRLSLEVRLAYAKFRKAVGGRRPPGAAEVETRVRHAAVAIAKLAGRDVYPNLRLSDRALMGELQGRLLAWLRGDDGLAPRTGLRLWQDLEAFAGLLQQVNHRAELQAHDARLAYELLGELEAGDDLAGVARRARPLYGREEALDALLDGPGRPAAAWRSALEEIGGREGVARPAPRAEEPHDFI